MTTMAHSALGYTAGTDTGTTEPWVRVDLQFERRIGTVILKYVTGGCCVSRMNNLQVRVGNSSDNFEENAVCASLATAANANVLPCDAVGRYVFVVLVGDNRMLNIHEVEVYGVDRMNECVEEVEGVSPCYEVGYFYDTAAKACVPCTNYKPDGASYTTNGGVRNYCDWVCDSTSDQFVYAPLPVPRFDPALSGFTLTPYTLRPVALAHTDCERCAFRRAGTTTPPQAQTSHRHVAARAPPLRSTPRVSTLPT